MAFQKDVLLNKVVKDEGFSSIEEMLEAIATDCVVPGICTSCMFTCSKIEPDARFGWCENCGKTRVQSVLIIAGFI